MASAVTSRPEVELAELKQRFSHVIEQQQLSNLINDYALYHDKCFGSKAGPEDDSAWENLFDVSGILDLYIMGSHQGREGKMAWAQKPLGGRGRGCQIRMFNTRVHLNESDPELATGCSYAMLEVVPDDVSKTLNIKGQYDWTFKKVDGLWKVAHVKLSSFVE